jgi:hypothetical protein
MLVLKTKNTINIHEEYDLDDDFDLIEVIEYLPNTPQTSYNRPLEYDAVPMNLFNNREDF